nr:toxin-antitoxin system HicB family antitoxin [uncultured Albidiferax sp.]
MPKLTIRLPDEKHARLKSLAQAHNLSVNRLVDELATVALANYDAHVHFQTRAARGDPQRALQLLESLDAP